MKINRPNMTPADRARVAMTLARERLDVAIAYIESGRTYDAATWFALAEMGVRRAAVAFDESGERGPT